MPKLLHIWFVSSGHELPEKIKVFLILDYML